MHTDSFASNTPSESRSASEWAITVGIPSSLQARMMRTAISPRLATSTLRNIWGVGSGERGVRESIGQCRSQRIELAAQGVSLRRQLDSIRRLDIAQVSGDFDLGD